MFVIVLEIGLVLYRSVGVRIRSVGVRTVNGSTHFTHFSAGLHTYYFVSMCANFRNFCGLTCFRENNHRPAT